MSRFKLRSRLRGAVEGVKTLAKVIHDESKHPGRPQPHMAAKNPLWGGDHTPNDNASSNDADSPLPGSEKSDDVNELPKPVERAPDGGEFWFLKETDADGWHETNPGLKGASED